MNKKQNYKIISMFAVIMGLLYVIRFPCLRGKRDGGSQSTLLFKRRKPLNSLVCCHLSVISPECDTGPRMPRFLKLLDFNLGQLVVIFKYSFYNRTREKQIISGFKNL